MRAGGGEPGRRDLLLLPGRRRLRHTDTTCGTRVRACVPPKLATCSRQPTTGRTELQHATNQTCQSHRAGRSDHARVGTSAHPKANRTHATRANTGDVPQTTCRRHRAGRQRAAETEQQKPSSSSSHAERAPDATTGTECTDASGQRATHDMQWTTRGGRHCSGRAVAKRQCSRRHAAANNSAADKRAAANEH